MIKLRNVLKAIFDEVQSVDITYIRSIQRMMQFVISRELIIV